MAMKDLLYRLKPFQIYTVLVLSIAYFLVQLLLSHTTHALTLLVDAYHMLCNIVALSGCIMTIKQSNKSNDKSSQSTLSGPSDESKFIEVNEDAKRHSRALRNTFGWTRIDIITMLIVGIFLAAFCFSLLVEAVQTLIHIDHQDTMHHPVAVIFLGVAGLVLNGICFLLIGGYTHHQGSFLHITSSGDVVLDGVVSTEGLRRGERRLSRTRREPSMPVTENMAKAIGTEKKQLAKSQPNTQTYVYSEIFRDICSTIFAILCAIIVQLADNENVTKFVDPIISIISCIVLLWTSYPYMKEACLILLQTIPDTIDIELFKADLLKTFDDIVSVHDLHIWQLTSSKYVSTVHILFQDPKVYAHIKDDLTHFFHDQGITIVTIQPEFKQELISSSSSSSSKSSLAQCLIGCQSTECALKTCCSLNELDSIVTNSTPIDKTKQSKYRKSKNAKKSTGSLLSLNVSSLAKFRKSTTSELDGMKKSVSETHVGHVTCDRESSTCTSTQAINLNATKSSDEINHSERCHNSNALNTQAIVEVIKEQNENDAQNTISENIKDKQIIERDSNDEESALKQTY